MDGGRKSYMGAIWRRRLLFDLLGAPGLADAIVDMSNGTLPFGMIRPRASRLARAKSSPRSSPFRPIVPEMTLELAERMGVPRDRFQLDFFGGTMFSRSPRRR